ncbi:MAG: EAL domain-containing protein [Rhizobacter sp.]|nr:EAL domain-containing protein [Rhizobacter sp.]
MDAPLRESGFEALSAALRRDQGRWAIALDGLVLKSVFQPVYSLSHGRPVGHEALVRAFDASGARVASELALRGDASFQHLLRGDRAARMIHALNFAELVGTDPHWLFFNMQAQVFASLATLTSDGFQRALQARCGIQGRQVVLEVLEQEVSADADFDSAARAVRASGGLIAIDDFGAGRSNFDRVWRIAPEIVKLDRSLVRRAALEPQASRIVTQMVSLLHQCGALVLMEGIETQEEACVALDANADLVQGELFGSPQPTLAAPGDTPSALHLLWEHYEARRADAQRRYHERIRPYINAIGYASALLADGKPFAEAVAGFLQLPLAEVCYLLGRDAMQIGDNVWASELHYRERPAFAPMRDTRDAHWARRPYYRRAMEAFGRVQVTRPYRTLHGAHLCVTISVALRTSEGLRVVCGDVGWSGDLA